MDWKYKTIKLLREIHENRYDSNVDIIVKEMINSEYPTCAFGISRITESIIEFLQGCFEIRGGGG